MYNYDYSSYSADSALLGAGLSAAIGFMLFIGFIALVAVSFEVFARWVYFKKCGEGGWKAIIPVYNEITLLKTAGMNWWWVFILYASSVISLIQSMFNAFQTSSTIYNGYYDYTSSAIYITFSFILGMIAIAAAVFTILTKIGESINIAKKFGKSGGYGALIFFFEPIMFIVLAFSKSAKYDKNIAVSPNGLFGGKK